MKRTRFLKGVLGLGLLSVWGCKTDNTNKTAVVEDSSKFPKERKAIKELRKDLIAAWDRSETMTMTNVKQMPPDFFTFKYTEEAMSFAEQWRHCVVYTCGQLAGRTDLQNPYENSKLPVQMSKDHVIAELENMYAFVRKSIAELSDERLCSNCDFAGDTIPVWRLFYAMENHIIHHRGQCVVYLRLNGVVPKGFYGW
ncbi:MAG: DinB family protein [Flavobacteriaceae bacterium]